MIKRDTILISDDCTIDRTILSDILEDKYKIIQASNGTETISLIETYKDNLLCILQDLFLSDMTGIDILEWLKDNNLNTTIPVIIISGDNDYQTQKECFKYDVYDFLPKPFHTDLIMLRIENAIFHYTYKENLENTIKEQTKELQVKNKQLNKLNSNMIELFGSIIETRNLETGSHIKRVKKYTEILTYYVQHKYPEYNITSDKFEEIVTCSAIHDIGKLLVPDTILLKPAKLTPEEFELMKQHTVYGTEILEPLLKVIGTKYQETAYNIIRYHHEKFDGNGYPDGLKGDDIPIEAQIVSIADCFDALTNKRIYKAAMPIQEAYKTIVDGGCGKFSTKMIDTLTNCLNDLESMYIKIGGDK